MVIEILLDQVISKGELFSDSVYRKTKLYLPFIARLCLLSSSVQDNIVISSHWVEILDMLVWEHELFFRAVLIIVCLIGRTIGIAMVLFQKKVPIACGLLAAPLIIQLMFPDENEVSAVLVGASIVGSLIILVAESFGEADTLFAGIPTLDNQRPKNYLKLSGRCFLVLMFINFISFQPSLLLILQDILGSVLMILVVLGYKTKLSVLAMIVFLNVINFSENNWWALPPEDVYYRMYIKQKFLQGLTVSGGLLMIVLYGPGKISLDEAKKKW